MSFNPDATPKIIALAPDHIEAAAKVLARAFQDDPLQSYVFPDPAERQRLSPLHFTPLIRYGLLAGRVWATENMVGLGVWMPPEHTEMDEAKLQQAGFFDLPNVIGNAAFERFTSMLSFIEPLHKRDAGLSHWYAMVIGVDPEFQGQRVGAALLRPAFEQADRQRVPCYLETAQPRNVRFYTRNGFRVMADVIEPSTGMQLWTFRRDPQ